MGGTIMNETIYHHTEKDSEAYNLNSNYNEETINSGNHPNTIDLFAN